MPEAQICSNLLVLTYLTLGTKISNLMEQALTRAEGGEELNYDDAEAAYGRASVHPEETSPHVSAYIYTIEGHIVPICTLFKDI